MLSFERKVFTIICVILFICSNFCLAMAKPEPDEPVIELAPDRVLKDAGLEKVWQSDLPLKTKTWWFGLRPRYEQLERLIPGNNKVFVLTNWGYLYCIRNDDGRVLYGQPLIKIGFNISNPISYDNRVLFIAGNSFLELDSDYGEETRNMPLGFVATTDPARNESFVYVGGSDRRLHAFTEDGWVKSFTAGQDNLAVTAVAAEEGHLFYALEGGKVICTEIDKPDIIWWFDTGGTVSAKLVLDGNWLYVSSQDTNIYKLNTDNGKLGWRFQAGGVLTDSVDVTDKYVYQYVPHEGLTAIDKESGKQIWVVLEGRELLAENGKKSYIRTIENKLVVMDNEKRQRSGGVEFSGVSRFVTNILDEKIFVATESGRVSCLKPVK